MQKNLFFIFTFLFFVQVVDAQYNLTKTYTEEEGLAPGIVNVISQDQYGYIWVGTRNGLSIFDGRNFTTFIGDVTDSIALRGSEVFDLCHTKDGNIWIATGSGLSFYDRKTNRFKNYDQRHGLKMNVIKKVVQQNDSILWVGHWFGIDKINIKKWNVTSYAPTQSTRDTILNHHSPNHIKNLKTFDKQESIIISHQNFIKMFDQKRERFINLFEVDKALDGDINDFHKVNEDELIITTGNHKHYYVYNLQTGQTTKMEVKDGDQLSKILTTSHGEIIILDRKNGPKGVNPKTYEIESINEDEKIILPKTYNTHFVDDKDRIWVGSFAGIQIFSPNANRYYVEDGYSITSTVYDPNNKILIGLNHQSPLLFQNENGRLNLMEYNFDGIDPFNIIYSKHASSFLSITNSSLTIFNPISNYRKKVLLSKNIEGYINQISEVENGILICAGQKVLKVSLSGEVSEVVSHDQRIYCANEYDGGIFFSCIGNLFYLKDEKINQVYRPSNITRARGLTITGDTSLWFTEIQKGLHEIDLRDGNFSVELHGKNEGLSSQIMFGIYKDDENFLIPATYCFYRYDPKNHKVTDTYRKGHKYASYDLAFDIHTIDDDHYASGVAPGIMVFPKKSNQLEISDLRIAEIKIRNEDIIYDIPPQLILPHYNNDINIQLMSCYFGDKNDITYYYKTTKEEDYNLIGASPILNFNNLPPGNYNISVKAISNNNEIELENAIEIIIKSPWYATTWFFILCLIIIGASILYWNKRRMAHLNSQHEIEKKLIHLESIALKSQINPHFLFNSLNGIRTLISLKENDKAIMYVSHLSQLLRDSLTYHQSNFISLSQELAMNEHYLALEKLRFDEKLTWEIKVEPNVDLNDIKIPPFTLQPLIENAIHHGIRHLNNHGHIVIKTSKTNETVKISILDNGVGLKKAAELQKGKIRLRDHIGLSIVEKRIILINGKLTITDRVGTPGVEAAVTFKLNNKRDEKI